MRFDHVHVGLRVVFKGRPGTVTYVPPRLATGQGYLGAQSVTVAFDDGTTVSVMPRWLQGGRGT